MTRIAGLLCGLAGLVYAQNRGVPWSELRADNPPGTSITLRLIDSHAYRQGELILAELHVPSPPFGGQPPPFRWQFAGLLLDPSMHCGTVAKPCFLGSSLPELRLISGLGPMPGYRESPLALNAYLPALAPGHYRAAALARKLVLGRRESNSTTYVYPDPPEYAVSDAVAIEVIPSSPAWVSQTIAKRVAELRAPISPDMAGAQAQQNAARQLALLNDPAAWQASLELLPLQEGILLEGLANARSASSVCDLMQARVSAPAQYVSSSYLYDLTEICARAHLPPALAITPGPGFRLGQVTAVLSATPPPAPARVLPPDPQMKAWAERRQRYTSDVMTKTTASLAASLAGKQPQARSAAVEALLQRVTQVRNSRPQEPDPAWIPLLAREFVRDFDSLDLNRKQSLLSLYVSVIASPDVIPLLERVLDTWRPGDYYEAAHTALRALNRVDPARAQARILAELGKDKTWLDVQSLDMLPASAAPPMDDALIEALASAQRPGGWNPQLSMAALALYATPKALLRIRAIYESQQNPCQPELMAYFVRVDPAYSERVFRGHAWDMHTLPPPCTVQYFHRTPPLAMNRALEQYLAAYLMHSDVYVKTTAAQMLGKYGTPAALPQLWDALRYFHDYWQGKADELARNGAGMLLEVELRNAIARGRGWLTTEADLHLIDALCISGNCRQETRQDLEASKLPLRIGLTPGPRGLSARVAQYYGLDGMAALKAKLAQFPSGTRFILEGQHTLLSETQEELQRFAAEKGLLVRTQ